MVVLGYFTVAAIVRERVMREGGGSEKLLGIKESLIDRGIMLIAE